MALFRMWIGLRGVKAGADPGGPGGPPPSLAPSFVFFSLLRFLNKIVNLVIIGNLVILPPPPKKNALEPPLSQEVTTVVF